MGKRFVFFIQLIQYEIKQWHADRLFICFNALLISLISLSYRRVMNINYLLMLPISILLCILSYHTAFLLYSWLDEISDSEPISLLVIMEFIHAFVIKKTELLATDIFSTLHNRPKLKRSKCTYTAQQINMCARVCLPFSMF